MGSTAMASRAAVGEAISPAGRDEGRKPCLRHLILLVLLIAAWGISWPTIKLGVAAAPPLWYACFRYWIATVCMFAFVAARQQIAFPPRSDWPLVAVSGVLQMAAYSALTGLALTILPPGRASVLAFSTPIWVVLLAAWWLREQHSRRALLGVGLGILGALTIAGPSLRPGRVEQLFAYAMLLGAAAWAISIIVVRAHRFTASALALAPWQMLVAGCVLPPVAMLIEGAPQPIAVSGVASLAYVGPIATAFAYWAVVEVGRGIRASTMSMALLAAPCLGILISAVTLGETVGASLIAGVVLVGAGIRLVTAASPRDRVPQR